MTASQRAAYNGDVAINGVQYRLDVKDAMQRRPVPTQPGDSNSEFERRLVNLALGWGNSKWVAGGYDYAVSGNLHRKLSWLPGAALTDRTPGSGGGSALHATAAIGRVSFCEYWDPADSTARRMVVVSPRHIYEVNSAGTVTLADLGAAFTTARGMTKGVLFRAGTMATPKVYVARQSNTSTDYFVVRTGAGTYAVTSANKVAAALASGKDSAGADVLWRVDENGKLNSSLAGNDPDNSSNWASTLYDSGPNTGRVNDLCQQARALLVGREDGAFTFDNALNAVPVTMGMEQTPDVDNFRWFKDFNGMAICPSAQGILSIDGLEWGVCGPVSANTAARSLRNPEVAVSDQAGEYVYGATFNGTISYLYLGTPHSGQETGRAPFAWHGPIATTAWKISDLKVSTCYGTRLWVGGVGGQVATIDLNSDFSPKTDEAAGFIYLPEGWLDMSGPGVIKDLRKAEFIAPAGAPFSATNQWTIEIETTPGSGTYTAIDGGYVSSGVYGERYWSTATSGQRLRGRLRYSGNAGAAECEAVIVRGTERPETTDEFQLRLVVRDGDRLPAGGRRPLTARTDFDALRALVDAAPVSVRVFDESFTARVTSVDWAAADDGGERQAPERAVTVVVRKVKTS